MNNIYLNGNDCGFWCEYCRGDGMRWVEKVHAPKRDCGWAGPANEHYMQIPCKPCAETGRHPIPFTEVWGL